MKKPLRALIIEDSEFDAVLLVNLLRLGEYEVTWRRVETDDAMRDALRQQTWDIIFSDHQMPHFSAPQALDLLHQSGIDLPFIIVSGGIGEATAVALMKAGAHDFLMKGNLGRLVPAVERELREAANRGARRAAEQSLRASEQRYRLLWENSPDAILMMDHEAAIVFANPAAEIVFGSPAPQLLGRHFTRLLAQPNDGSPALITCPLDPTNPNHRAPIEVTGKRSDGLEIIVEVGFCDLAMQGRSWFVAFVRDITGRRQAELALLHAREEFRVAREIQQHLFPETAPALRGYDIAGVSFPAEDAGGDYFDYLPMLHGGLGIVIGDVSGHGMGPALIMAETRAYLRIVAMNRQNPSDALVRANRVLAHDLGNSDRFVTVLFVRLDPQSRRLTYCNAGHPAGFVLGADGTVKHRLTRTGKALGMNRQATYEDAPALSLDPGDLVLLLTDGVEEAVDDQDEAFGPERALDIVRQHRHLPSADIVRHLYQAIQEFSHGGTQHDDITVVILKSDVDAPPAPP